MTTTTDAHPTRPNASSTTTSATTPVSTCNTGMTSHWAIKAREEASLERRIELDVETIDQWSRGLDVKTILLTPARPLPGEGG